MTGNDRIHTGTFTRLLALALCAVLVAATPAVAGPADDAKAAEKAGRMVDAAEAWARALDTSPKNRAAALGLTRTAIRASLPGHYLAAEDSLRTLLESTPSDAELLVALGRICLATSAAKKDTLAKKSYDDEAKRSFEKALASKPTSDGAAGGLAQAYYQMGDFANAIKTVDDFLAKSPAAPARALFWKGQTLYLQALDAFRNGGNKMTAEARAKFSQAKGAYEGSVQADGSDPQAWIQLAYAGAYLGDVETAGEAYRKAAALDPSSRAPILGLQSLYTHTPGRYVAELQGILKKNPDHVWALWHYGDERYKAGDFKKAREMYAQYAAASDNPGAGYYAAGLAATQQGEHDAAERLYYKALKADPNHLQAAGAIAKRIMDSGAEQRARKSVKDAQAVIKQFEPLLEAAPAMAWIRNNLGFILREAYVGGVRGGGAAQWRPILKAATKVYTEGAELLGEWTAAKEASLSWAQRYAEAQIISDTGLMYQFYDDTRDYETAERYYTIALEYTDDGYRDAFNNLAMILNEQKRWQDLYDLAAACAESITTEEGAPDEGTRRKAAAIAKQLLADGRANDR